MTAGFYNDERQPGFGFTVAISICLHIVFITLVFLLANGSSSRKITAPIYTVDLFAPGKPITPPKVIEPANQKINDLNSQRVKEERAITLKKTKEPSLDEALKRIKERVKKREAEEDINKAIEGLKNKQIEKRLKEYREKVVHRQVIVKPAGQKTESAVPTQQGGAVKRIEELEEKYGAGLWEVIQPKWNYMGDIKEGEVVVISLRIDKNGRLVKSHVEQSSGNLLLVQSAIRAIEKAAPLFPPLPQELGKDFVDIGVCFPECEK